MRGGVRGCRGTKSCYSPAAVVPGLGRPPRTPLRARGVRGVMDFRCREDTYLSQDETVAKMGHQMWTTRHPDVGHLPPTNVGPGPFLLCSFRVRPHTSLRGQQ